MSLSVLKATGMHVIHKATCRQNTQIHKIKNKILNKFKKKKLQNQTLNLILVCRPSHYSTRAAVGRSPGIGEEVIVTREKGGVEVGETERGRGGQKEEAKRKGGRASPACRAPGVWVSETLRRSPEHFCGAQKSSLQFSQIFCHFLFM